MEDGPSQELIDHLCRISALSARDAERLICEVHAFYNETATQFIRRRHSELRAVGLNNAAIFEQIEKALAHRRFPSEPLTQRQIRRVIYG